MSRKTFSVLALTQRTNAYLATDAKRDGAARQALMTILESVLHETGNYNGFKYLTAKNIDIANATPGINTTPDGQFIDDYRARFAGTDRTRVEYFIS